VNIVPFLSAAKPLNNRRHENAPAEPIDTNYRPGFPRGLMGCGKVRDFGAS
jgi:hypothetical protein